MKAIVQMLLCVGFVSAVVPVLSGCATSTPSIAPPERGESPSNPLIELTTHSSMGEPPLQGLADSVIRSLMITAPLDTLSPSNAPAFQFKHLIIPEVSTNLCVVVHWTVPGGRLLQPICTTRTGSASDNRRGHDDVIDTEVTYLPRGESGTVILAAWQIPFLRNSLPVVSSNTTGRILPTRWKAICESIEAICETTYHVSTSQVFVSIYGYSSQKQQWEQISNEIQYEAVFPLNAVREPWEVECAAVSSDGRMLFAHAAEPLMRARQIIQCDLATGRVASWARYARDVCPPMIRGVRFSPDMHKCLVVEWDVPHVQARIYALPSWELLIDLGDEWLEDIYWTRESSRLIGVTRPQGLRATPGVSPPLIVDELQIDQTCHLVRTNHLTTSLGYLFRCSSSTDQLLLYDSYNTADKLEIIDTARPENKIAVPLNGYRPVICSASSTDAFSPNGKLLALMCYKPERGEAAKSVLVWSAQDGQLLHEWKCEDAEFVRPRRLIKDYWLRFTPDGQFLLTHGPSGLRLWDIESGVLKNQLTLGSTSIERLDFVSDGTLVVVQDRINHSLRVSVCDSRAFKMTQRDE